MGKIGITVPRIRIPDTFTLHGQTIKVNHVNHLASENAALGETRPSRNSIILQDNVEGYKIPLTQLEEVFLHEMFHLILHHADYKELCNDERFVEICAQLLHQAFTSMTYKEKKIGKTTSSRKP